MVWLLNLSHCWRFWKQERVGIMLCKAVISWILDVLNSQFWRSGERLCVFALRWFCCKLWMVKLLNWDCNIGFIPLQSRKTWEMLHKIQWQVIAADGILYLCMYLCSNINKISGFRKANIQISRSCFGMAVIRFVSASPNLNPGMSSEEGKRLLWNVSSG